MDSASGDANVGSSAMVPDAPVVSASTLNVPSTSRRSTSEQFGSDIVHLSWRKEITTPEEDNKGKEACTKFQRLSTDGVFSVVRCEPVTGRTHQIRVHLQHLGHPIANDDLYLQAHPPKRTREGTTADTAAKTARSLSKYVSKYGNSEVNVAACRQIPVAEDIQTTFRVELASGRASKKSDCQVKSENEDVIRETPLDASCQMNMVSDGEQTNTPDITEESNCEKDDKSEKIESHLQPVLERDSSMISSKLFVVDRMCTHCPNLGPSGYKQDDEGLWLQCVRYTCAAWTYECPLPTWAL